MPFSNIKFKTNESFRNEVKLNPYLGVFGILLLENFDILIGIQLLRNSTGEYSFFNMNVELSPALQQASV